MSRPLRLLAYDVYTAYRRRWLADLQHGNEWGLVAWLVTFGIIVTACLLAW